MASIFYMLAFFSLSERIFVRKIHTTSIVARDAPPWVDTHYIDIRSTSSSLLSTTLSPHLLWISVILNSLIASITKWCIKKYTNTYNINSLTYTLTSYTRRNEKSKRQWMKFFDFIWVVGKFFKWAHFLLCKLLCRGNTRRLLNAQITSVRTIESVYDGRCAGFNSFIVCMMVCVCARECVCIVLSHISLSFSIHFRESSMKKRDG